jgi:hypothetical protein
MNNITLVRLKKAVTVDLLFNNKTYAWNHRFRSTPIIIDAIINKEGPIHEPNYVISI